MPLPQALGELLRLPTGSVVVSLANLALRLASRHHFASPGGGRIHDGVAVGNHAGYLQLIADGLLLWTVVDAGTVRLVHLDDTCLVAGGIINRLLFIDLVQELPSHLPCTWIRLYWMALAVQLLLFSHV